MSNRKKWILAVALLICGAALIIWNLRDPDRAYREPAKEEREVTLEQVPMPVQAAVKQASAGGTIEEIKEEHQGGKTTYEVDIVRGDTKTEIKFAEDGSVIKTKSKKLKPADIKAR
jgi:uncharacterized membrane protein YkoI